MTEKEENLYNYLKISMDISTWIGKEKGYFTYIKNKDIYKSSK